MNGGGARRSLVALVAMLAAMTTAGSIAAGPAGPAAAQQATTLGLRLVAQPMTVAPDATLPVTLAVEGDIPPDAVLSIVDHRPMRTRAEVGEAIAGDIPTRQLDRLDIPIGFVPRDSKGQLHRPDQHPERDA